MLNFIYYPVSWILWLWHQVFGFLLGPDNGVGWALSVMFLVFTLRAILYKPFVAQVRSMRKMQEFQPELAKLRKKYANDRQKQAEEMQRLQREHGVNPLAGCLPVLVQVPVFIGLFHVLREFGLRNGDGSVRTENYVFDQQDVIDFNRADLFGAKLANWVINDPGLATSGTTVPQMLFVMIPLMIAAGVFTHITARHSVARQTAAQGENPQTAIMNKLMLYVFPIGVVVGAPFLPLAILLYWVSNNLWTLGQQWVVYRRIDREEAVKKQETATKVEEQQKARAPKPGQKPVRPAGGKTPGSKPIARRGTPGGKDATGENGKVSIDKGKKVDGNGAATNGSSANGATAGTNGDAAQSVAGTNGTAGSNGAAGKDSTAARNGTGGTNGSARKGGATAKNGAGPAAGSSRSSAADRAHSSADSGADSSSDPTAADPTLTDPTAADPTSTGPSGGNRTSQRRRRKR